MLEKGFPRTLSHLRHFCIAKDIMRRAWEARCGIDNGSQETRFKNARKRPSPSFDIFRTDWLKPTSATDIPPRQASPLMWQNGFLETGNSVHCFGCKGNPAVPFPVGQQPPSTSFRTVPFSRLARDAALESNQPEVIRILKMKPDHFLGIRRKNLTIKD